MYEDPIWVELCHIFNFANHCLDPECSEGFDRLLAKTDFVIYEKDAEEKLSSISTGLGSVISQIGKERISWSNLNNTQKHLIIPTLILCGEHSSLNLWSTNSSVNFSSLILRNLLNLFEIVSLEELLLTDNNLLFKSTLLQLRPKLLSSTWKCNPSKVLCYSWLLIQVKAPFLGDHLNDILPTALIITDDFETNYRLKGLKCINHIVSNVSKEDLELQGHNEVILDGLRPILYQNQLEILEQLFSCIIILMQNMNSPLQSKNLTRTKFDDIFDIIINNFYLEERNNYKVTYLNCLPDMIIALRLRTLRHSKKLFDMIARELILEADDHVKGLILEVLDVTVKTCWPRIDLAKQCRAITISLFKLLHDLSSKERNNRPANSKLVIRIRSSFQLLKTLQPNLLDDVRQQVKNQMELEDRFKSLIDFVLV